METGSVSGVTQSVRQQANANVYDAQQTKARNNTEAEKDLAAKLTENRKTTETATLNSTQKVQTSSQAKQVENPNPPAKSQPTESIGNNVDTFA